jgi:hypothetical protein
MSEISTDPHIQFTETDDGFMIVDNPITQNVYAEASPAPPPPPMAYGLETIDLTEPEPEPTESLPSEELVGQRIEVRWHHPNGIPGNKKWYSAKVLSYCPRNKTHICLYDDGDRRVYQLWRKAYHVLDKK